jgi:hypothetical protein
MKRLTENDGCTHDARSFNPKSRSPSFSRPLSNESLLFSLQSAVRLWIRLSAFPSSSSSEHFPRERKCLLRVSHRSLALPQNVTDRITNHRKVCPTNSILAGSLSWSFPECFSGQGPLSGSLLRRPIFRILPILPIRFCWLLSRNP